MTGLIVVGIISAVTGVVLTVKGIPYNGIFSTVHKLLSVAAAVWAVIIMVPLFKEKGAQLPYIALAAGALLAVVAAVASGGLLLGLHKPPVIVQILHRVTPWAAYVLTILLLAALQGGKGH